MRNARHLLTHLQRQDLSLLNWIMYGAIVFFICLGLGLFAGSTYPPQKAVAPSIAQTSSSAASTDVSESEVRPAGYIQIGEIEGHFDARGYTTVPAAADAQRGAQ